MAVNPSDTLAFLGSDMCVKNTFIYIVKNTFNTAPARMCGRLAQSLLQACRPPIRKHVGFNLECTSIHEVIPYREIYGALPQTFVFDRDSQMVPAARRGLSAGFVSLASQFCPPEYDDWEVHDFYDQCHDIVFSDIEELTLARRRLAEQEAPAARRRAEGLAAELQRGQDQKPRWQDWSDDQEATLMIDHEVGFVRRSRSPKTSMSDEACEGDFELIVDSTVSKTGWWPSAMPAEKIFVRKLLAGGWAESRGLHIGDELMTVEGRPVAEISEKHLQRLFRLRPLRLGFHRAKAVFQKELQEEGANECIHKLEEAHFKLAAGKNVGEDGTEHEGEEGAPEEAELSLGGRREGKNHFWSWLLGAYLVLVVVIASAFFAFFVISASTSTVPLTCLAAFTASAFVVMNTMICSEVQLALQ